MPFFIVWPGKLPAGKTYDRPVISLDILPTACALAGVKTPANVDGVNLMPYLLGKNKADPHEALYWRFGPQKAIRKGNWSLVDWRNFETKTNSGWQLYDLSKDIGQQNNLAAKHPELVAELSQGLAALGCPKYGPAVAWWCDGRPHGTEAGTKEVEDFGVPHWPGVKLALTGYPSVADLLR